MVGWAGMSMGGWVSSGVGGYVQGVGGYPLPSGTWNLGYHRIQLANGQYASYWNAFLLQVLWTLQKYFPLPTYPPPPLEGTCESVTRKGPGSGDTITPCEQIDRSL